MRGCVLALYDFLLAVGAPDRLAARAQAQADAGMEQLFAAYPTLSVILVTCGENGAYLWVDGDWLIATPDEAEEHL